MTAVIAIEQRDLLGYSVIAILILFAMFVTSTASTERRRRALIPWAHRPGPGDEELERRVLWRYYALGGVATLFMAIFLPALLIAEPYRIESKTETFLESSIARGSFLYGEGENADPEGAQTAVNCARCHGREGEGGVQPVTINKRPQQMQEPPLAILVARYKEAGRNPDEIYQLVVDAIERGRPGTPMPTWGLQFGGPLNAQQVQDLVNFILAPKEQGGLQINPKPSQETDGAALFAANCAICHGKGGEGFNEKGEKLVGPNLMIELERNSLEEVERIIREGRVNYNRPSMPAWAHLGDTAIKALVEFIQSIQRGGSGA